MQNYKYEQYEESWTNCDDDEMCDGSGSSDFKPGRL